LQLGLPDVFIDHGDQQALMAGLGLNAEGIETSVRGRFGALLAVEAPRDRAVAG